MAELVERLVNKIMPILAGHGPTVQSAVLADLLAMLLAGHFGRNVEETNGAREDVLTLHLELVRKLVQPNEQRILENKMRDS
jgi:hypothetical protein